MFSLPHYRLLPFPLLFPLFVHTRFPRAAFGGADFCRCLFLMAGK